MTPSQIIAALGGAAVLAAALGFPGNDVGAKRVRAWDLRKRIPSEYWVAISAYASRAEIAVTLDDLANAHAFKVAA